MATQWSKLIGFFLIFVGIILICVLLGGYSSLYRSEGRIENSKEFLLDACQKRLNLVPKLLTILKEGEDREVVDMLKKAEDTADTVVVRMASLKAPLDKSTTLELEISQYDLTKKLVDIFRKLDKSAVKYNKKEFFSAQDKLFIAKSRYNTEVRYFETRTKIFPGFIIAKIFGFNKSRYYELSDGSFLEAEKIFGD